MLIVRRFLSIILFTFLIFGLSVGFSSAQQEDIINNNQSEFVKDEIIVKYRPAVPESEKVEVAQEEEAEIKEPLVDPDYQVLKLDDSSNMPQALNDLNNKPEVEYAEQNAIVKTEMVPNDPLYRYQWNFNKINMPQAWDIGTGQGAVVAVVDTGVAYENYNNFRLVSDLSGTSFTQGWNFVSNTPHANDDNGHGTHVAGTIAQTTNNGYGVSGVAYQSTIMPVKVLGASGSGTTSAVANGIRWAADNGAKVINLSLGSSYPSKTMEDAVNYARNTRNVTVVAAAGNGARGSLIYPAAYDAVIAVAATDYNNNLTWYSQYGPGLDVSAPGGDTSVDRNGDGQADGVLQQTIGRQNPSTEGFYLYQGTSMATPHVSGVAALLVSKGASSANEVYQVITGTARDLGSPGYDARFGYGLLDAAAALRTKALTAPQITYPVGGESLTAGNNIRIQWNTRGETGLSYRLAYTVNGSQWTEIASATPSGATYYDWQLPDVDTNTFRIRVRAVSNGSLSDWSESGNFTVSPPPKATLWWDSGPGNWDWLASKIAKGDFNGDRKTDIAILYGYRGNLTRVFVFTSNGGGLNPPQVWWDSGPGNWDSQASQLVSGNFNNDGRDDLAVLYGYANRETRAWVFESNGSGFNPPQVWWDSGPGNWDSAGTKLEAGDFNNDRKDDLVAFYGYFNERVTKALVLASKGDSFSYPDVWWNSGVNNWDWVGTKLGVGDFDGNGQDDLVAFYGYFNQDQTRAWVFGSTGSAFNAPSVWFDSGPGNWNWHASKLVTGNITGDSKTEAAIFYGYSGALSRLWILSANVSSFSAPQALWDSGQGRWDWSRSQPILGDFDGDNRDEAIVFYNYGDAHSSFLKLLY